MINLPQVLLSKWLTSNNVLVWTNMQGSAARVIFQQQLGN